MKPRFDCRFGEATMMSQTLEHANGRVHIDEKSGGRRRLQVEAHPGVFVDTSEWTTAYPVELIEAVLAVKGPGWLCDEIRRDEDPLEVESDLRASIFSYLPPESFAGGRLLDFGCGCGASTAILARLFPETRITGVELDADLMAIARKRAAYHGIDNAEFHLSPAGDQLPPDLGAFDFVYLSAVYEHLLPHERKTVLPMVWRHLAPGGVIFINQTPDRRFPLETHTSGLPLINYLPDGIAGALANRFSRKSGPGQTWESLLRNGIRGGTPAGVVRDLAAGDAPDAGTRPQLLPPLSGVAANQAQIWYHVSRRRLEQRFRGWRRGLVFGTIGLLTALRVPVAPYLSLAIRKVTV